MLEKEIEKYLRDRIKNLGGIAYKFISPGNNGVPDRIVLIPGGKIIFVQLKNEHGKTSNLQDMQIARIRNLGFNVRIINSKQKVDEFINEIQTT